MREGIFARLRPAYARYLLWQIRRRAKPLPALDGRTLVVFAPHQDDETLGCGGLIALKRRMGANVAVVWMTDGSRSHEQHGAIATGGLVGTRQTEALNAMDVLGVSRENCHFLDAPDGGLSDLSADARLRIQHSIRGILDRYDPGIVCSTLRNDMHPDHEATHRLVRGSVSERNRAVELLEYPVWSLWHMRRSISRSAEFASMCRMNISKVLPEKLRAISCFRSQIMATPDRAHPPLSRGFLARFSGPTELFLSNG